MKKYSNIFLLLLFVLISACSSSDDSQGVVSTEDLSTVATVTTIVEDVVEETLSPEDAELFLARCLRDNGYDVQDPKNDEGLRSVLTPIFIAADERGRTELFRLYKCVQKKTTFLWETTQTLRIQKMLQTGLIQSLNLLNA